MWKPLQSSTVMVSIVAMLTAVSAAGQGRGGRGMMGDAAQAGDMLVFHQLFDHRQEIKRQIIVRPDGVETITESTNPDVIRLLQTHVESMLARVREARPVHQRDPLFAELFRYAAQIEVRHKLTPQGIRVVETSRDTYAVKLLQAHADVVTAFITNGRAEMMKNHAVPARER